MRIFMAFAASSIFGYCFGALIWKLLADYDRIALQNYPSDIIG